MYTPWLQHTDQTTLWSTPYTGQVRLVDGNYVTEGRVEVYCSDQWGTVCNFYVDPDAADTVCVQLGYSVAQMYSNITL